MPMVFPMITAIHLLLIHSILPMTGSSNIDPLHSSRDYGWGIFDIRKEPITPSPEHLLTYLLLSSNLPF
jgi:hypothetical protein